MQGRTGKEIGLVMCSSNFTEGLANDIRPIRAELRLNLAGPEPSHVSLSNGTHGIDGPLYLHGSMALCYTSWPSYETISNSTIISHSIQQIFQVCAALKAYYILDTLHTKH